MGKWEMVRLSDIVDETITGEWGTECADDEVGTKVLRTTNFTNSGVINYDNVVVRNIAASKVEKKKLKKNDIILEKSGGSDNQPVGRVVLFENEPSEVFLCNNFTQVLRIEPSIAFPRYVFLYLFRLHKNGTTELLQNKTTGIRNLQVKQYMALEIPLPPLPIQQQIADVLDRASALIEKRKAQIDKLDLLVKSQFIEMFGDPVTNPKGWESHKIHEYIGVDKRLRLWYTVCMRKATINEARRCPICGKIEHQVNAGRNRSGTQRCFCNDCKKYYTLEAKTRAYTDEMRQNALKIYYSGVSGRGVGKILGMSKANVYNWIKKNG